MTLMPGWIDTHVHIANHFDRVTGRMHSDQSKPETPEEATMYLMENAYNVLMSGFTTVQSPGAPIDKYLRQWAEEGRVAGPRVLTSLRSINENTGSPDEIRAFVRKVVADGADFVKIFATKSIREGGAQTMTDAQIQAACGEAKALGKRAIVHAQGPEGAKASILAGCTIGREYEELIYRVKDGGQPPMDAIISLTSTSAESIGLGGSIGAIAPGLEADLVATPGNPLQDITVVRHVAFVMKGGRVYKNVAPAAAAVTVRPPWQ
ncbi:MAG TPA: amidohydrolase family protein [Vicinamibacterales bacterium]|nr:amidohydrolase family protein [Vicinamibacterales bacterium]